jgi:hypothetical protein
MTDQPEFEINTFFSTSSFSGALCGSGSEHHNTTQLALSAGSLVNALLSAAGVLVHRPPTTQLSLAIQP